MFNSAIKEAGFDSQQLCYFRLRLMMRLLTVFIFITIALQRLIFYCADLNIDHYFLVSLPFVFALALIIIAKYILYRKIGPRIFKYTKLIDLTFTLVFVIDWIFLLHHQLKITENGEYSLATLVSLLGFSWRTLIQVLMSQHWVFKIIPTLCAYAYVLTFAVRHQPDQAAYALLMGIFQAIYVVLVFYFEHRVNFRLMMGNLKQEQWLQLNEFILNSIPENIVIMDMDGECKFISEHLKKLMRLRNRSSEPKRFFRKITELQRLNPLDLTQETTLDFMTFETPSQDNSHESGEGKPQVCSDSLEDLIELFRNSVARDLVKDKSVYIFNGKFKQENTEEERSFEINITFLNHQFNKHILLILRDTTDRDLVLTLQGNIAYKDHLLATVSHELRTPLNGNINLLQTALKASDKYGQIKDSILEPALKCSKFLLHMINDLLDMSQIKAQKLRLVFQQLNIKETLINSVQLLELYAKKKNLTFETDISNEIPDSFCTDHQRLSQIVVNLMNNAIKTTQKGFVKLSAWSLRDKNKIQICLEDSGSGLTEEATKNLFKDFSQIEHKKRENLNLASFAAGLKIANDLAELLGPKDKRGIIVNSVKNQGSKFSFIIENKETGLGSLNEPDPQESHRDDHLPAIPNEIQPDKDLSLALKMGRRISFHMVKEHSSPNLKVPCKCAKVLVVDDDPFNIMAYEVILNSIKVKYECVYSGKCALEKMLNKVRYPCSSDCHPYRVVFMDEEMPEMTGTQTVAEIQRLQKQNLLPQMSVIGCSAHHEGEEIERFLKSGITEYIPKPISKVVIKKIVDKYGF